MAQFTVENISQGEYKEKGSSFIAYLCPFQSVDAFEEGLYELWKKYHDARHICYAYRIGKFSRENDDGEPNHSAGSPIMRALQSAELINVGCMVVRYFGGIKLGVPGLIKAYGTATKDAIQNNVLIPFYETVKVHIEFEYDQTNMIKYLVQKNNLILLDSSFAEKCSYFLLIRLENLSETELLFGKYVNSWEIME